MDPQTTHKKVRELFDALADLPEVERAVGLAEARLTDPEVADQAERLLSARERAPELEPIIVFDECCNAEGERLLADGETVRTPIGPIEIVGLLSDPERPSSAEVYEGRHADAGRVAVKLLRDVGAGHEVRRRFIAEAEALRSLDHPHIARLLSAGLIERSDGAQSSMGIITRFVPGPTLDDWAAGNWGDEVKGVEDIVRVISQIARALEHIHLRQILHRDIKPSNIIIESGHGQRGFGVLLDLGVAKFVGERWDQFASLGHTVAGTLRYMAPEQLTPSSSRVDYRADLYALGAVLYELLADRPIVDVDGCSEVEVYRLKMDARPQLPKEARGVGSLSVRALALQSALVAAAARPEDRYTSAGRFADDLDRAIAGRPLSIKPMGWARRLLLFVRRHPAVTTAVALVAAGFIAWGATYVSGQRDIAAARERAEARFEDSRAFARWAIFGLSDQLIAIENTTGVRRELIHNAAQTLERLSHDPVAGPDLLLELAEGYERLGELLNGEMGDIAQATAYFQAADRLLSRSPDQDSPHVILLRTWLNFLEAMAIDADYYPVIHSSQIAEMIETLDGLEPVLSDDPRLYHWRSRVFLQLSRHLVVENAPAEAIIAAVGRCVADAETAWSLDPKSALLQSNYVLARYWRAHAFDDVEHPRIFDAIDEVIEAARWLESTGHGLADLYLARSLSLRCYALARTGNLANFTVEAMAAIDASDKAATRQPSNRWPNRQAEVVRIILARKLLQSPAQPEPELLDAALLWANEALTMWHQRVEAGWTSAYEDARYPDTYQGLIRQLEAAIKNAFAPIEPVP